MFAVINVLLLIQSKTNSLIISNKVFDIINGQIWNELRTGPALSTRINLVPWSAPVAQDHPRKF